MTKEQYIKVIESIIKSPRNDLQKITMLKYSFETYVEDSNVEKINQIKEILVELDGVADSQEFGLNYGQAIGYLEEIKDIIK